MGIRQTVRQASVWGICLWYRRHGFCDLVWVDFEDFSDKFDVWMMVNGTTTGKPVLFNLFLYVFHNEKATNDCITSTVSFDKFAIRPDSIYDVNLRRCCSTMPLRNPRSFNKVETPSLYHPSTYLGSSKSFRFPRFYHPCELATTPDKKPPSRWRGPPTTSDTETCCHSML